MALFTPRAQSQAQPKLDEPLVSGRLELLAKQVVEGFITGLHKSPFHGFSVEFSEHRLYNAGESTRTIDWRLYGRTDKLFSKRFEEETNLRCQLVVDTSPSMYFPDKGPRKVDFSALGAASLMQLMRKQRDAFGLTLFNNEITDHQEAKSTIAHQQRLLRLLENELKGPKPASSSSVAKVLHEIAERTHRRSLIMVFSDFFDAAIGEGDSPTLGGDFFSALQHLRYNKHEVVLFWTQHGAYETKFDYASRPHLFVDLETGQKLRLNPAEVRDAYVKAHDTFQKELETKCAQYRIDLVPSDIREPFGQVLLTYLLKRQRMLR